MRYISSIIALILSLAPILLGQYDRGYIYRDLFDKVYGATGATDTVANRGLWRIVAGDSNLSGLDSVGLWEHINRHWKIVTDYGAVPNDGNPDGAAFQAAMDDAASDSGGVVYIPPGIYDIERTLELPWRVHLLGSGGIVWVGSNDISSRMLHSTVLRGTSSLSGAILRAKGDGPSTLSSYTEQNSMIEGVLFDGRNMTSLGSDSALVFFKEVQGVSIRYCGFDNSPRSGLAFHHTIATSVTRISSTRNKGHGVAYFSDSDDSELTYSQIGLNSEAGVRAQGGTLLRIQGNKIFNNSVYGLDIYGIGGKCSIVGNDFHDGATYGVKMSNLDGIVFSGNVISDGDSIGLYIDGITNSSIIGNTIKNNEYGIYIQSNNKDNAIVGNNIYSNLIGDVYWAGSGNTGNEFTSNVGDRSNEYGLIYNSYIADSGDTLNTSINSYVKVGGFRPGKYSSKIVVNGDSIVVNQGGIYLIQASVSFQVDAGAVIEGYISIGGSVQTSYKFEVSSHNTGQVLSGTVFGIFQVNSGDDIELYLRNTGNSNPTYIRSAQLMVKQLTIN